MYVGLVAMKTTTLRVKKTTSSAVQVQYGERGGSFPGNYIYIYAYRQIIMVNERKKKVQDLFVGGFPYRSCNQLVKSPSAGLHVHLNQGVIILQSTVYYYYACEDD